MNLEKELKKKLNNHKKLVDIMFNTENYPEHLRLIVKVILEDGENLTDGIEYYATYEDILRFAEDIYNVTGAGC